jgi:hypothetical protein
MQGFINIPPPTPMPDQPEKMLGQRLLAFLEHPFFLTPIGTIGGIVGILFYTPVLAVCGLCILAAFHRAKVVSGKPLWIQIASNVVLFLIVFGALWEVRSITMRALQRNNLTPYSFARLVAEYLLKNDIKQSPDNSQKQQMNQPPQPVQPEIRSYLVFDGESRFPTVSLGGQVVTERDFQVGDDLAFLVMCNQSGPNPVEMVESSLLTYAEPNYELSTQKTVIADFEKRIRRGRKAQPYPTKGPFFKLMPGEHRFFTAFSPNPDDTRRVVQQADLDKMKSGNEILFVIAQFIYRDNGKAHNLRRCEWLQPPSRLPGIWHSCVGFYSD